MEPKNHPNWNPENHLPNHPFSGFYVKLPGGIHSSFCRVKIPSQAWSIQTGADLTKRASLGAWKKMDRASSVVDSPKNFPEVPPKSLRVESLGVPPVTIFFLGGKGKFKIIDSKSAGWEGMFVKQTQMEVRLMVMNFTGSQFGKITKQKQFLK